MESTDGTSLLCPHETSSRHTNKTSRRGTTETSWRRSTETSLGVSFETYLRRHWDVQRDVVTTSPRRLVVGWVGVIKAKRILLYIPVIEWYLRHGLRIKAVHQSIKYDPGMLFSWFPEEVANARREADKDPLKKQLVNIAKLKGNSFYRKMIEYLGRHKSKKNYM